MNLIDIARQIPADMLVGMGMLCAFIGLFHTLFWLLVIRSAFGLTMAPMVWLLTTGFLVYCAVTAYPEYASEKQSETLGSVSYYCGHCGHEQPFWGTCEACLMPLNRDPHQDWHDAPFASNE